MRMQWNVETARVLFLEQQGTMQTSADAEQRNR
uniref:Uncharacterized protein n=1 Tax=viral metagenome TaxID=1070528 RepID=A0A6C0C2F6_9ZZZZ